ncbi:MAG TPA: multicopper oxidase domain-containing protein [Nevskiaceae bacterium]
MKNSCPVSRRRFLKQALALCGAGLAAPAIGTASMMDRMRSMMDGGTDAAPKRAPPAAPFTRRLTIPPLLHGEPQPDGALGYRLRAGTGTSELLAGLQTPTWGYNGAVLGPALVIPRGKPVRIAVKNHMDQPTTVHWHGAHVPGRMDGGPHSLIQPGATLEDHFTLDQPGATLWYHPHPHGTTGPQVYGGLAGLLLVDDGVDRRLGLPHAWGVDDLPLIVQDRRIAADGMLLYMTRMMDIMGMEGDRFLVNGREQPFVDVPAQWIRLRLLNGSNRRVYHFGFNDGRAFHAVASDAGLLAHPVTLKRLRLFPAERAEILVDLRGARGQTLVLASDVPADTHEMGRMAMGAGPAHIELLQLRVGDATDHDGALPDALADLPAPQDGPVTRRFALNMAGMGGGDMMRDGPLTDVTAHSGPGGMSMGIGGRDIFSINGQFMRMNVIDARIPRGVPEVWEARNAMMMQHSFHMHGTSFRMLSRNGRPPPEEERGWKDVAALDPFDRVRLALRFDQPAGDAYPFMYHCHMLEHEDNGMMGQFTVG